MKNIRCLSQSPSRIPDRRYEEVEVDVETCMSPAEDLLHKGKADELFLHSNETKVDGFRL